METILNIYLIIEDQYVKALRAVKYTLDGDDESKITYLKNNAVAGFETSEEFPAPKDKDGEFMKYSKFSKLERRGMHFFLYSELFEAYGTPDNPLICVTPVVNGELKTTK